MCVRACVQSWTPLGSATAHPHSRLHSREACTWCATSRPPLLTSNLVGIGDSCGGHMRADAQMERHRYTHAHTCTYIHARMHLIGGCLGAGLSGRFQRVNAALAVQLARTWTAFNRTHEVPCKTEKKGGGEHSRTDTDTQTHRHRHARRHSLALSASLWPLIALLHSTV